MELGVAGMIAVKQISGEHIEKATNKWLSENPDVEVIDIKFSTRASSEDWASEALNIYRKED